MTNPLDDNGECDLCAGKAPVGDAVVCDGCGRAYLAALPSSLMEVVTFDGVAKQKLDGLIERGWKISGYSLYQDGDHGLITAGGFVGWFSVAERNDADARAKLEAAEAERDALREKAQALLDHWDERDGPEKRGSFEGVEYWSPAGRMVDTQFIADLRKALEASK